MASHAAAAALLPLHTDAARRLAPKRFAPNVLLRARGHAERHCPALSTACLGYFLDIASAAEQSRPWARAAPKFIGPSRISICIVIIKYIDL
jgi:hypothetical protein